MARTSRNLLQAVDASLASQETQLAELRARQLVALTSKIATGTGDINHPFKLDGRFRLVFIRCHFSGTSATAAFSIAIDSLAGSAYDATLFTVSLAGLNKDVHLRIGSGDTGEPAAWTFQSGDSIRIKWTNPDSGNITWGLEVGLTPAS